MTLAPLVLRQNQEDAVNAVLRDKSHLCRAEGGAGKTVIGVEAVLRSGVQQALIVAPLNTLSGWRNTFERQGAQLPFRQITSKPDGKDAHADLMNGVPGYYFIGWQYFRNFAWKYTSIEFVIADESHRQQNWKSITAQKMNTTIKAKYKLALSATPAGNRMEGLWQTMQWLWPKPHTPAYWTWITEFFESKIEEFDHGGEKKKTRVVQGERNPGAVWRGLPSKSYFKSPYQAEPIVTEILVKMSPAQQKLYDRFEEEAVVWLDQHPLVADLPVVQSLRLREMTLAVPSIRMVERMVKDEGTGESYPEMVEEVFFEDDAKSSKIDAVLETLEDLYAGGPVPVLMFTHSRKFATVLAKRLQSKGYRARQFIGGMSAEERAWKLDNFGKEFELMVCTIATVGEGTDGLQNVCNIEFWLSVDDNRIINRQAQWRLSRMGQKKTVRRFMFRAEASVETRQAGRLAADQELLDQSLEEKEAA